MAKMRAVQVPRARGTLELVERDVPEPKQGEVRVRVEACGVCHSDNFTVEGQWPNLSFPRIPGRALAASPRYALAGSPTYRSSPDSPLEGGGFELPVRGRGQCPMITISPSRD